MNLAAYNGNRPNQRVFLDIWLRTRNVEQGHVQKDQGPLRVIDGIATVADRW